VRALTLWEPWASCVAAGLKEVETRPRPAPRALVGERIAVHSAKAWHQDIVDEAILLLGNVRGAVDRLEAHLGGSPWEAASYPLGCVVATAVLGGNVPSERVQLAPADDAERRLVDINDWTPPVLSIPRIEWWLGNYSPDRYAIVLRGVRAVTPPAPARGMQGWWTWDDAR
jgi:hypothetical protein